MDDLISRQDAIDLVRDVCNAILSGCCCHYDSEVEGEVYDDIHEVSTILKCNKEIRKSLMDLPSAQPQRWIPVSERMPEERQSCLVTEVITNGMKSVLIAKFANDLYKIDKYDFARRKGEHGWFCYDCEYGCYYDVDVLAWMPLPDPYKEGEA